MNYIGGLIWGEGGEGGRGAHKHVFPLKSTRLPTRNWPFSIGDPKESKLGLCKMSGVGVRTLTWFRACYDDQVSDGEKEKNERE